MKISAAKLTLIMARNTINPYDLCKKLGFVMLLTEEL